MRQKVKSQMNMLILTDSHESKTTHHTNVCGNTSSLLAERPPPSSGSAATAAGVYKNNDMKGEKGRDRQRDRQTERT